jgi:hypothetical protein
VERVIGTIRRECLDHVEEVALALARIDPPLFAKNDPVITT